MSKEKGQEHDTERNKMAIYFAFKFWRIVDDGEARNRTRVLQESSSPRKETTLE